MAWNTAVSVRAHPERGVGAKPLQQLHQQPPPRIATHIHSGQPQSGSVSGQRPRADSLKEGGAAKALPWQREVTPWYQQTYRNAQRTQHAQHAEHAEQAQPGLRPQHAQQARPASTQAQHSTDPQEEAAQHLLALGAHLVP